MNKYFPYKELSYKLVGIFYKIRNQYGNAQKEKVYQNALAEELEKLKIPYKKEVEIPIKSPETGKKLGNYRIDFVVDEKIVVEIKALNFTPKKISQQTFTYLKHTPYEIAYLVNFGATNLYFQRYILTNDRKSVGSVFFHRKSVKSVSFGFTLMEILIVITLIVLLATAVLILFNPKKQLEKAWDGKRKKELNTLQKVLEDWYNDKNCYPKPNEICYDSPTSIPGGTYVCHICGNISPQSLSPYLERIPCDPQSPQKDYLYQTNDLNCPNWYRVYAKLSNLNDPIIAELGCQYGCGPGTFGFLYQYGVTSPNVGLESGPGDYYCQGLGNCTYYNKNERLCFPSFSSPSCDGDVLHPCQRESSIGICVTLTPTPSR